MADKNTKGMTRPAQAPAQSDERGYAMAVLLVGIAVMLILMTVAMPVWRQQQKREREEELLFRLKQYAHALALYQRRLPGASPADVDDLVKQRFLRKKYKDPMTGKDFAVLRVGQVSPGMSTGLPGGVGGPFTSDQAGGRVGSGATGGGQGSTTGGRPAGTGGPGGQRGTGVQPGLTGGVGGAVGGIRGVVSTSKEQSIRVWKGRTQYDQWEVAIEDVTPRFFGQQTPQPGDPRQPGGRGQNRPGPRGGQTGPTQTRPGQPGTLPPGYPRPPGQ